MYLVVSFPEEELVVIVPDSWHHEDKCYWPPYKTIERVKKAVFHNETPEPHSWTLHPVIVLKAKGRLC